MTPAGSNERQLSSDAAAGFQTGIAMAMVIGFVALGVIAWIPGLDERLFDRAFPAAVKLFPFGALLTGGLYLWSLSQQCDVYLRPEGLRIVRGRTEILVPLSEIRDVSQPRDMDRDRVSTITIEFRHDTPLGRSIKFMPPFAVVIGSGSHPLVDELRRRAGHVPS